MTILHDVYIALLSGLTHKTGNEIHWQNENGHSITVEPVNIEQCKYIVRYYYNNGQKFSETECQNGQQHGKSINWYENGQKAWEYEYKNGQLHGKIIGWYRNGQKCYEREHQNGQLHGKSVSWYTNGQKFSETEYQNGELIK